MYNLKEVYAVLSFEEKAIKLLVVDRKNKRNNCLFFKKITLDYCNDNLLIEETKKKETVNVVRTLIKEADIFLGIIIEKYIINIAQMPLYIENDEKSCKLLYNEIPSNILLSNEKQIIENYNSRTKHVLKIVPYEWSLDNKIINNILPEIKGKILIEKYFLYSCDKKIINAYEEILKLVFNDKKVDKSIIRFTTNALSQIGSEDINNTTIVNINANDTIFYKYDNNKNLTNIDTFIGGYKEIENKIINFFEEKIKITDCSFLNKLSKINNLIKKTDFALLKNIPLVNVFSNSNFLSYSEINCEILFLLLRELNTNFFIKLFEQKKDVSKKIITLFDESIKYFTYANDNELFRLNNATFFEEEAVVGLEGNIVCNLLKACDFVEKENKSKDVKEYSIIPYVNQKVANKHIKNNFFTSIGILTTAWAAKIGGE